MSAKDQQISQLLVDARRGVESVQAAASGGNQDALAAIGSNDLAAIQQRLIENAQSKSSEAIDSWRQAASIALLRGKPSEANTAISNILDIDPDDLEALHLVASCHAFNGNLAEMRNAYDKLRRAANVNEQEYWLWRSFCEQGEFESQWRDTNAATHSFQKAIEICRQRMEVDDQVLIKRCLAVSIRAKREITSFGTAA